MYTMKYLLLKWKQRIFVYKGKHLNDKALVVSRILMARQASHWKQRGQVTILVRGTSGKSMSE